MLENDLRFFFFGFLAAGLIGYIIQQLLLRRFRARRATRRVAEVPTEQSAKEIYKASLKAQREAIIWIVILVLVVIAIGYYWFVLR